MSDGFFPQQKGGYQTWQEQFEGMLEGPFKSFFLNFIHRTGEGLFVTQNDVNKLLSMARMFKVEIPEEFPRESLEDKGNFHSAKGMVLAEIWNQYFKETRPRNMEAENLMSIASAIREGVEDEWKEAHPEETENLEVIKLQQEIEKIKDSIEDQINKKVEERLSWTPPAAAEETSPPSPAPSAPSAPLTPEYPDTVRITVERSWLIGLTEDDQIDCQEDYQEPGDIGAPVNMTISIGSGYYSFLETFYTVHFTALEGYRTFVSRLKQILNEMLSTGKVDTQIQIYRDFQIPNPLYFPEGKNGQISRKESHYRIRRSREYDLRIMIGKHVIKWYIECDRASLDDLMGAVERLSEMVLLSGAGEAKKQGA